MIHGTPTFDCSDLTLNTHSLSFNVEDNINNSSFSTSSTLRDYRVHFSLLQKEVSPPPPQQMSRLALHMV
ncbi:hypothetical protein E2C01_024333 [Portunus trituberculatus]|uniref:Uncharacterized protein n=1 Tax=Portunus trituberculatus TaxID=210409 RepID=A0A5B7ECV9_PORTR|nr:hypothetical protein [Portunus trituberculatus]